MPKDPDIAMSQEVQETRDLRLKKCISLPPEKHLIVKMQGRRESVDGAMYQRTGKSTGGTVVLLAQLRILTKHAS